MWLKNRNYALMLVANRLFYRSTLFSLGNLCGVCHPQNLTKMCNHTTLCEWILDHNATFDIMYINLQDPQIHSTAALIRGAPICKITDIPITDILVMKITDSDTDTDISIM